MEHLQRVWHASRERLPFRTPGSVPILGLANAPIVETKFLELAMSLLDFSPRIPLGTFSILLLNLTSLNSRCLEPYRRYDAIVFSDASSVAACAFAYMIRRYVTFVLKTCIGDSAIVLTWSLVSATRSGGCFDKAQSGGADGRGHCD